jgi:hypothetical protein
MSQFKIHKLAPVPQGIYWSVIEMLYFENGEVFGRVIFNGTEKECEAECEKHCKAPHFMHFEMPGYFKQFRLESVAYNCIATTKPCKMYHQSPSNIIGRS